MWPPRSLDFTAQETTSIRLNLQQKITQIILDYFVFLEIIKNLKELKTMTKYLTQQKTVKARDNPKIRKRILTFSLFAGNATQGSIGSKNKRFGVCDMRIEGKSYTFKKTEIKVRINKDLSCYTKK